MIEFTDFQLRAEINEIRRLLDSPNVEVPEAERLRYRWLILADELRSREDERENARRLRQGLPSLAKARDEARRAQELRDWRRGIAPSYRTPKIF